MNESQKMNDLNDLAIQAAEIWDPEEVSTVEPMVETYLDSRGTHWLRAALAADDLLYLVASTLIPDGSEFKVGASSVQEIPFNSVSEVRVDGFGCVITRSTGRPVELSRAHYPSMSDDDFKRSAMGIKNVFRLFKRNK